MKTKCSSGRSAPRLWRTLRNSSLFSIPHQNEASRENGCDGGVPEKFCDNGGLAGRADTEMVPDYFGKRDAPSKKRQCFRTNGADESSDLLNEDPCSLCDKANGHVLLCSEIGCPIALDEKCMNGELDHDDIGNFYCPYCWYKKQILRSKALREKAMATEKALSNFLDEVMIDGDQEMDNDVEVERHGTDLSFCRKNNPDRCKDRMDIDKLMDQHQQLEKDQLNDCDPSGKDDHDNEKTFEDQQQGATKADNINDHFEVSGKEERRETENLEDAEEDKHEGRTEDRRREDVEKELATDQLEGSEYAIAKNLEDTEKSKLQQMIEHQHKEPDDAVCEDENKSGDGSVFASVQEIFDIKGSKEDREIVHRKKQLDANERESSVSSTASTNKCTQQELDGQSLSTHLLQRRGKQIMRSGVSSVFSEKSVLQGTSPVGNRRNQGKKVNTPKTSLTKRNIAVVCNERRKKLFWTPEEEQVLRKGMEKFSIEAKKNIPWSKILESGKDVFHETRTPIDLKDKWRNMTGRNS